MPELSWMHRPCAWVRSVSRSDLFLTKCFVQEELEAIHPPERLEYAFQSVIAGQLIVGKLFERREALELDEFNVRVVFVETGRWAFQLVLRIQLAMLLERRLIQYFQQSNTIIINLLPDGCQMVLFGAPITARGETVSGLDVQVVLRAVQFPSGSGYSGAEPGFVRRFVLAETRIAVYPEQAFRQGNVFGDIPVALGESVDDSLGKILHVLPSMFVGVAVFLEPLPVVVLLDGREETKGVGMYGWLHNYGITGFTIKRL